MKRLIAWSVAHSRVVLAATLIVLALGAWAVRTTSVDAIPDLSDVQVIVMTEWPGQAPQLVEDQITYPLQTELLKVPHTKVVRGMSQFGLSAIYVVFEDGTDLYWARSRVLEYLNGIRSRLPNGALPTLGPDATGVGWVMQYIIADTSGRLNLADLRAIQDFHVRPALTAVSGVSEIASLGGFEREYQVQLDPVRLQALGMTLPMVSNAVRASNQDVGGRSLEMGGTEYVVRGRGRFASIEDIRGVAVGTGTDGTPVTVADVGSVAMGPSLRRGITDLNGRGEIVTGWIVMRTGANPRDVITRVKAQMAALQPTLPAGVVFIEGYDRSKLIDRAVTTLRAKLVEESIIVALVALLFLMHASSALVAILTLPVAILMALLVMRLAGLSANIMSLGGIAIAIGAMIDAAIVMVENLHKHIERNDADAGGRTRAQLVVESAQEVGPALFTSLLIITASFLPVFALGDQEGRLFRPLAITKTLAMASAAFLSVTLVPVLMTVLIRGRIRQEASNPLNRLAIAAYGPMIRLVLRYRWTTVFAAALVMGVTIVPWRGIGSEFMPPLHEGSMMDMPSLAAGIGTEQAKVILRQRDAALASIPEVATVLGKIGRAESATDMAPMSMIETVVTLKDPSEWRPGVTYDSIVGEANARVRTPGVANMWSMPIRNRLDMLATGIKTPVGIKIFGPSLDTLDQLGKRLEQILSRVAGSNTVFAERAMGGRYLNVVVDRVAAARYGLTSDDVQQAVADAAGGTDAGTVLNGRERFGVRVRYLRGARDRPADLRSIFIRTPAGVEISAGDAAKIEVVRGPTLIKSEDGLPHSVVYIDVQGRDIGSFVHDAKSVVANELALPTGYRLVWSGQYEALERATRRLMLVVPLTLLIIIGLLYLNFRSMAEVGIVLLSLPFALAGGVWLVRALHYNMSVAVGIGFIALAGVAAETGVIMLLYLDQAYRALPEAGRRRSRAEIDAAIMHGAVERVRPKLMTVIAIMAGLIPILWSQGTGADVMKRIAAPMVGGMFTSTVLTLLVIPAIYSLWRERPVEPRKESVR